jgi:branched-chain amino acid transport system permease protein
MIGQQLAGNLTNGLVLGGVYGMATMGLSLIFGVLKIVNVGHGAFIMVGAFITLWMFSSLGMTPVFALPVALITGMAVGFLLFYTVIRRLVKAPELASLLATFAIGMLLEEAAKNICGTEFRGYNWETGKLVLPMTVLPMSKIYAFAGSVAIAALMYFWFKKTRAGTAVRSVVEDSDGAQVCGVNVGWVYALSFAIGIGLTVLSGVLLTMFIPVGINPYMGDPYTLKAFVVAVLGGLASPYGAFFAGLAFGLIENGSYTVFAALPGVEPFALTRFLSFVMLLVILLIKPTGLLGAK